MPETPDEPMSSEDLLRRAREDYLTPPPRDAEPPGRSSEPPPPVPRRTSEAPPGPVAPSAATGAAESEPDVVEQARRTPPTPELTRPADAVGTPAGFEPEQATQRKPSFAAQLFRFRGILLPVLIIGGIFLFNAIDDSKAVDRLAVGDCLMEPDELEISSVEARDCAEPHQLEVYATVIDPADDQAAYPGDDEAFFAFFDRCVDRFRGYVGVAWEDSEIYVSTIYPTAESWRDGDRSGSCVLYEPDSNGLSITRTGSLRNAGR